MSWHLITFGERSADPTISHPEDCAGELGTGICNVRALIDSEGIEAVLCGMVLLGATARFAVTVTFSQPDTGPGTDGSYRTTVRCERMTSVEIGEWSE